MKKLIVVLLVALLAVALVACNSEDDTTASNDTTAPKNTTTTSTENTTTTPNDTDATTPEVTTTETPVTNEPPVERDGEDIMWNDDPGYMAINPTLSEGIYPFMFEDSHGSLDFHMAMVFAFNETAYGVYEELFIIPENETVRTNNTDYKWVITVNGRDIEVTRFSLFDNTTSGWVRADLGADFIEKLEFDSDNICPIEASLNIYGTDGKVAFYADLTADSGAYELEKPNVIEMIKDENRSNDLKRIMPENLLPYKGPDSGNGEGYTNLFDNDVRSKLCGNVDGEENAIIVNIKNNNSPIVGFSLVNANDNNPSTGRTVTKFEIFVSKTGQDDSWTSVYTADGNDTSGNPIDKGSISTNYAERYFAFSKAVEATDAVYVKLVINNGEMAQLSEFILWTE